MELSESQPAEVFGGPLPPLRLLLPRLVGALRDRPPLLPFPLLSSLPLLRGGCLLPDSLPLETLRRGDKGVHRRHRRPSLGQGGSAAPTGGEHRPGDLPLRGGDPSPGLHLPLSLEERLQHQDRRGRNPCPFRGARGEPSQRRDPRGRRPRDRTPCGGGHGVQNLSRDALGGVSLHPAPSGLLLFFARGNGEGNRASPPGWKVRTLRHHGRPLPPGRFPGRPASFTPGLAAERVPGRPEGLGAYPEPRGFGQGAVRCWERPTEGPGSPDSPLLRHALFR